MPLVPSNDGDAAERDAVVAQLGTAIAAVVNHFIGVLKADDQAAVTKAVGDGTAELRMQVSLRPYVVALYLHFPQKPADPLGLASFIVPGEAPEPFSKN